MVNCLVITTEFEKLPSNALANKLGQMGSQFTLAALISVVILSAYNTEKPTNS